MSELIVPQAMFEAFIDAIADRVADKLAERNPQPEPLPDNTVFDLKEAAEYMHCSEAFVRKKVRAGEIAGRKQGKWLVYKKSIDEWIVSGGSA